MERSPLVSDPDEGYGMNNGASVVQPTRKSKKYGLIIILLLIVCVVLLIATIILAVKYEKLHEGQEHKSSSGKTFFLISDTHLDLYYNDSMTNANWQLCRNVKVIGSNASIPLAGNTAKYGRPSCDTSMDLLISTANYMKELHDTNNAEFVLLTGDQSAHSYDYFELPAEEAVYNSIGNSTKLLSTTLNLPVFPAIGNNDLLGDYKPPLKPNSTFYRRLAAIFKPYIFGFDEVKKYNSEIDFMKSFETGGFYRMVTSGGKVVLLLINTNYWSTKNYETDPRVTAIGDVQMKWFKEELPKAKNKGQKVIVAGHIPPGESAFPGEDNTWLKGYTDDYIEMVTSTYQDVITAQFYGHIHADKVKIQRMNEVFPAKDSASTKKAFLLTTPAITPNFKNNPGFRVVDYDKDNHMLNDYTQYHFDLSAANAYLSPKWKKEYSFKEMYGVDLNVEHLEGFVDKLLDYESKVWLHYSTHMMTSYGSVLSNRRFREYCAAKYSSAEAYGKCMAKYKNVGI